MVIGEGFAWAHLPKTGGDTTRELFQLFPGLVLSADPGDTNEKHLTFRSRREVVAGKALAMNIRRLPAWALSRAHHVTREGLYPEYVPLPMAAAEEIAGSDLPDIRLAHFTDHWRIRIDAFLRLEHLRDDFLAFVRRFVDVTADQELRVYRHPARDVADYDHALARWFTAAQLASIYDRNPRWAALEEERYGDLLLDPAMPVPQPQGAT
jgi:hypothetical protein